MTSLFVCPLCGGTLVRQDGAYRWRGRATPTCCP